jgi:hypothetical protein
MAVVEWLMLRYTFQAIEVELAGLLRPRRDAAIEVEPGLELHRNRVCGVVTQWALFENWPLVGG